MADIAFHFTQWLSKKVHRCGDEDEKQMFRKGETMKMKIVCVEQPLKLNRQYIHPQQTLELFTLRVPKFYPLVHSSALTLTFAIINSKSTFTQIHPRMSTI